MSHDFRGRHYTAPAGRIRAEVVEDAALRFWAPHGTDHHVRRSTLDVQVAYAHNLARAEQARMDANPLTAAIDRVDAIIRHRCEGGRHDTVLREHAILAYAEGRASVLVKHHHTSASLAANAIHDGLDLATHLADRAACMTRGLNTYTASVVAVLIPVNQEAVDAIEVAQWAIAARIDRPFYLQAAE